MNFGFDLEGTLDAEPEAFRAICQGLILQSQGVYVITAYYSEDLERDNLQETIRRNQLNAIGFRQTRHYTDMLFAPGDTAECQGQIKRALCEQMNVQLMFEDREVFADQISATTRCLLLQPRP